MMQVQSSAAPPPPPAVPSADQVVIGTATAPSPSEAYQGLRAQRRELRQQLESLESKRREVAERLKNPANEGANRQGLEQRIIEIDQRISALDKQIAVADGEVARAAAIPGATAEPPPPRRSGPPEEVIVMSFLLAIAIALPLTIAYARRIWRRGAAVVTALPAELGERLTRLEQAVDAIAVETERIGEGQRFVTRLFANEGSSRALGAGPAEAIPMQAREKVEALHRERTGP